MTFDEFKNIPEFLSSLDEPDFTNGAYGVTVFSRPMNDDLFCIYQRDDSGWSLVTKASTPHIKTLISLLEQGMGTDGEEVNDLIIPDWAERFSVGELEGNLQLCTRDGRVTGNAMIVRSDLTSIGIVYTVLTDAGNYLKMTGAEIDTLFYRGRFILTTSPYLEKPYD